MWNSVLKSIFQLTWNKYYLFECAFQIFEMHHYRQMERKLQWFKNHLRYAPLLSVLWVRETAVGPDSTPHPLKKDVRLEPILCRSPLLSAHVSTFSAKWPLCVFSCLYTYTPFTPKLIHVCCFAILLFAILLNMVEYFFLHGSCLNRFLLP